MKAIISLKVRRKVRARRKVIRNGTRMMMMKGLTELWSHGRKDQLNGEEGEGMRMNMREGTMEGLRPRVTEGEGEGEAACR